MSCLYLKRGNKDFFVPGDYRTKGQHRGLRIYMVDSWDSDMLGLGIMSYTMKLDGRMGEA